MTQSLYLARLLPAEAGVDLLILFIIEQKIFGIIY